MSSQYRVAFLTGSQKLEMGYLPIPEVRPNEVLVRIRQANVCPTDMKKYYNLDDRSAIDLHEHGPVILGHEASGVIETMGSKVTGFKPGDRVAIDPMLPCGTCDFCLMGDFPLCKNLRALGVSAGSITDSQDLLKEGIGGVFADYVKVPAENLYHLPDGLSFQAGAMMEPLADVLHSLEVGNPHPGETAVVFGLGAMGLMHIQVMHSLGVEKIIGIDPIDTRRDKGEQFGASLTINPDKEDPITILKDITHGLGTEIIFVCAGGGSQTKCASQALKSIRKKGRILLYASALKPAEIIVDINQIHYSMIKFTGTVGFFPNHARLALEYLRDGLVDINAIRTPSMQLEKLEEAFNLNKRSDVLKVGVVISHD
jgi:L-iditol 2-dehydrogenase